MTPVGEYEAALPLSGNEPLAPRQWILAGAVLVLLFLAYGPALRGGLIWDDEHHITRSELQSLVGLGRIWSEPGATPQYYPLVHSLFWLEHRAWGYAALGYHLTNVLLHALACFLLWRALRKLQIPGAGLAAAIFALHPVQVESVAWITEQKNLLSAVFYFAAVLMYLRYDESRRSSAYALASLLFALALLSKTVTATLPAALLVILWWRRGKLSWQRDILPLAPWLAVGMATGLFTAWVEQHLIGAAGPDYELSFTQRAIVAGHTLWFYLEKILWPAGLTFFYPRWPIAGNIPTALLYPTSALGLTLALWLWRRKSRGPLAGGLFFVGTLFPVLGFLNVYPFQFSFVADHFQYLACLGIIVPVAAGLAILGKKFFASAQSLASAALLGALALLTWSQSREYRSNEILYRTTIARNPDAWMAGNNLGVALADDGRYAEAQSLYEHALQAHPDFPSARYNLGNVLFKTGHVADAITQYMLSLREQPTDALTHNNLAFALAAAGQPAAAEAQYQAALRLDPGFAEAHFNLGTLYLNHGAIAVAIAQLEQTVRAQPNYAFAHNNLGLALLESQRADEAAAHLTRAIELDPGLALAHFNLGRTRAMQNRFDDAERELQTALRLDPNLADARRVLENLRQQLQAPNTKAP